MNNIIFTKSVSSLVALQIDDYNESARSCFLWTLIFNITDDKIQ